MSSSPLTYSKYLNLDQLLGLQVPQSEPEEPGELLFIVIHQVYELWFKVLLHELDHVKPLLSENRLFAAIGTFKRVRMVLKTLVGQLDILETLTPVGFLSFRRLLGTASGQESFQFRELEFVLGRKQPEVLSKFASSSEQRDRLAARLEAPSVVHHFYDFLELNGVAIPSELRSMDISLPTISNRKIQDGIKKLYVEKQDAQILLFEFMTDVDEGLQEWRYRHIKLIERTIGDRPGTAGLDLSDLKRTLFEPVFPDLWEIRGTLGANTSSVVSMK